MAKNSNKTIRVECEGAAVVDFDDLIPFQGNLKILTEESYQQLRGLILKHGISFPIDAWKKGNKIFIMDGHQTRWTMKRMRDEEGFTIPPVPVTWVKAATEKEAAEKLLAAAAQFGDVTPGGLHEFMTKFKVTMPQLQSGYKFPQIDMTKFNLTFFPVKKEVKFSVKEKAPEETSEASTSDKDHQCPKCGWEWDN